MLIRDVEMFIEHCENKGLAAKTIGSYEQTLRLLMLYLDEQGITQTEKITHTVIQNYVKQIKERGKYTVTSNPNSGNYQERRLDFGKKVSDVNLQKRYIYLPAENTKSKKGRYVFFSDKMAMQLQRWIKYKDRYRDSDFLFCTNKGKFLEVNNFEANVRKYAQRIGLKDIHPHVFRNNFAKRFLMSGGDIYTLSRLLGHSSVTVTEQAYLDVNQDDLAEMYRKHSPLSKII